MGRETLSSPKHYADELRCALSPSEGGPNWVLAVAILVDFAGQNKQRLRNRGFFYPVRRELGIQTLDPYPNGHDRELRQLHLLMAVAEQALHPDALSESSLYCEKATLDERMFGTGKRLLTDEIVEEYINLLRAYQENGLVEGGYYPYA